MSLAIFSLNRSAIHVIDVTTDKFGRPNGISICWALVVILFIPSYLSFGVVAIVLLDEGDAL